MKLKTNKGSVIQRSKYGVGKQMGSNLYAHINYLDSAIRNQDLIFLCSLLLPEDFNPNCFCINYKEGWIRFDEAPDFDTAREPTVGLTYKIYYNESRIVKRQVNQIWHHKWMWVKDDYKGFDVKESFEWSRKWLSKFDEPAKGSPQCWKLQLKEAGLK